MLKSSSLIMSERSIARTVNCFSCNQAMRLASWVATFILPCKRKSVPKWSNYDKNIVGFSSYTTASASWKQNPFIFIKLGCGFSPVSISSSFCKFSNREREREKGREREMGSNITMVTYTKSVWMVTIVLLSWTIEIPCLDSNFLHFYAFVIVNDTFVQSPVHSLSNILIGGHLLLYFLANPHKRFFKTLKTAIVGLNIVVLLIIERCIAPSRQFLPQLFQAFQAFHWFCTLQREEGAE